MEGLWVGLEMEVGDVVVEGGVGLRRYMTGEEMR